MDWIKVKDRLPPDFENILIYCPIIKSMTVAYLMYDKYEPIFYIIVDFDEYEQTVPIEDITHWMPLPESPKDE